MKKIIFSIFLLIFCLFFYISCPPALAVKNSHWKGRIYSDFGDSTTFKNNHNVEAYFNNDGTCNFIVYVNYVNNNTVDYTFKGTYYLTNSYNLQADGNNDASNWNIVLSGNLFTNTGVGTGDFTFNNNSNGTWELLLVSP